MGGLVIFANRCIDGWYESGNKSEPLNNRMHDLSDGFFIVGANSVLHKIPEFYHEGASMQTDDGATHIRLTSGKIFIKSDIEHEGNSKQTGNAQLTRSYAQNGVWIQDGGEANSKGTLRAGMLI